MVFGNMGNDSATGVAFTRNPGNGENKFYGEYLINAQGEDVVAGIRTPAPINEYSKSEHNKDLVTLEKAMPAIYKELFCISRIDWKNITTICRILNLPLKKAAYLCFSAA